MAVNWHRAQALLEEGLRKARDERDVWLMAQCGGDTELHRCVTSLLARRDSADPPSDALLPSTRGHSHSDSPAPSSSVEASDRTLQPGSVIGGYRLDLMVGEGGMGVVYRAHRLADGEVVAIKFIRPDVTTPERIARFAREQRVLRRFEHSNIARLLDADLTTSPPYLVMEFVDGLPITHHCREHRLGLVARLRLVITVCQVVGKAHAEDIVHRDLKPANILVTHAGEVKLLDFGIAKYVDSTTPPTTGRPLLTPGYASPEQLQNLPVTPASDVYSLGVTIYQLLTGALPDHHLGPPRVSHHSTLRDARIRAGDLDAVVAKALCRRIVDGRYTTTDELVQDLAACLERRRPSARAWFRRVRMRSVTTVVLVLVVIAMAMPVVYAAWAWATREPFTFRPRENLGRPRVAVIDQGAERSELRWTSTALAQLIGADLLAGSYVQLIGDAEGDRLRRELTLPESTSLPADLAARVQSVLGADLLMLVRVVSAGGPSRLRVMVVLQGEGSGEPLLLDEIGEIGGLHALAATLSARVRTALLLSSQLGSEMAEIRALMPSDLEVLRLYAEALQHLRDFQASEARTLLEEAVKRAPDEPLLHSALSDAWLRLGHTRKAAASACRARELATAVPRELRLRLDAQCESHGKNWEKAVDAYRSLWQFFPQTIDYGLALAQVQSTHDVQGAIATIARLRALPPPLNDDVRIDLAESTLLPEAAEKAKAARRAAEKAAARGQTAVRAQALRMLCGALATSADASKATEAVSLCDEAVAVARASNDANILASALNNAGLAYQLAGDSSKALASYEEAIKVGPGENQDLQARLLANAGNIESDLGRRDAAEQRYERSAALFRSLENEPYAATVDSWRALLLQQAGHLARAAQLMAAVCDAPPPRDEPQARSCQGNRAGVYFEQGRTKDAAAAMAAVIERFRESKDKSYLYFVASLAIVDISRARFDGVRQRLRGVLVEGNPSDDASLIAHQAFGNLALVQGNVDEAAREYRHVVVDAQRSSKPLAVAEGTLGMAQAALVRGDYGSAAQHARDAADQACKVGIVSTCALSLLVEGESFLASGDTSQAQARLDRATKQAADVEHHDVRTALARFAAHLQAIRGDVEAARTKLRAVAEWEWRADRVVAALETELLLAEISWRHRAGGADQLDRVAQRARRLGVAGIARRAERILASLR